MRSHTDYIYRLLYLTDNGLAPYISFAQSLQPYGSDLMLSAALYQLTQKNVLATDPVDTNIIASYAHTDSRATADTDASNIGKRRGMVPNNQASLWLNDDFGQWGMKNLKASAGMRVIRWAYMWQVPWRLALNSRNLGDRSIRANG